MDFEKTDVFELDLPPEYCQYKDEGCEQSSSCLNCPLPQCVYDRSWGKHRLTRKERDREIVRQFTAKGKKVREIAEAFGVSERTAQRAIRGSRQKSGVRRQKTDCFWLCHRNDKSGKERK